jgi:hypothetical protein
MAFCLLLLSSSSQANPCLMYFNEAMGLSGELSETYILNKFSRADIKKENVQRLSPGVYKVTTTRGYEYVLRFPSKIQHTDFEKFASLIFNEAPGVHTPEIKFFTNELSKEIAQALSAVVPEIIFDEPLKVGGRISLALFYPFETGFEYLTALQVVDQSHLPLVQYSLVSQAIKKLPPQVITQLADAWILATILGVNDLHTANWLIHGDRTIIIDLAYKLINKPSLHGPQFWQPMFSQHPLGPHIVTKEIINFLIQRSSKELRNYLRLMNSEKLEQLARQADYKLTARHMDYIESQIKDFLDRVD